MLGWAKRAEEDARCCKHAWHFLLQPSVSVLPDRLMVVLNTPALCPSPQEALLCSYPRPPPPLMASSPLRRGLACDRGSRGRCGAIPFGPEVPRSPGSAEC